MKNLDNSTEILLKHYNDGTNSTKIESIRSYNNHKIRHSIGVLDYWRLILLNIDNISSEYKKESELCFILHDLWRFYQNDWKKVLANNIFEHGDAWYNIAKKEWYLEDICLSIKYHNKKSIDLLYKEKWYINSSLEGKEKIEFLVNITRDADKLENMIYSIYNIEHILLLNNYTLDKFNYSITKELLDSILMKELVDKKYVKTDIDKILILLSWIFDINFNATKKILIENNYLEKIKEILKDLLTAEQYNKLEWIFEIGELELNNNNNKKK